MVRLARINIDQNFGLVQRFRSFVRCRQNAFFMECTAPAIVLVTPGTDGAMQVRPAPVRPLPCPATSLLPTVGVRRACLDLRALLRRCRVSLPFSPPSPQRRAC
mgnify:CR=1 FL=1